MSILLLVGLAACLLAAVIDLWRGTIPNALTYPLLVASPLLHFGLAWESGQSLPAALGAVGLSLAGLLLCSAVPLFMWWKGAIGGGDVKLFAAMGALLEHITGGHLTASDDASRSFQPMNINFGLFPALDAPEMGPDGKRLKGKERGGAKKRAIAERALLDLRTWLGRVPETSPAR